MFFGIASPLDIEAHKNEPVVIPSWGFIEFDEFGRIWVILFTDFSGNSNNSEVLILQQVLHQQEETSRIVVQDTHDAG